MFFFKHFQHTWNEHAHHCARPNAYYVFRVLGQTLTVRCETVAMM
jgi:hypothetical protein